MTKCYLDLSRGLREDSKIKHSPRLRWEVDYATASDFHNYTNGCLAVDARDFVKAILTPRFDFLGDIWDFTYKKHIVVLDHYKAISLNNCSNANIALEKTITDLSDKGIEVHHNLGNHERALFPLIGRVSKEGLFHIDRESLYETRKKERILCLHGDVFDVPVRFHQTREYLGTHAYELLTKACLFGSSLANNPTVRDVIESWGVKPPKTLSMFLKNKVDAWVFNAAFVQSAFQEVFRRNADILTAHKRANKQGTPPYINMIVCGHTHIPMIETAPSPRDENGDPIGPPEVKLFVTGSWVGPAKAKPGDDDKWWDQCTVKPRTAFVVTKEGDPDLVLYRPNKGIFSYTPPPLDKGAIVWADDIELKSPDKGPSSSILSKLGRQYARSLQGLAKLVL